jgi:F-type H+-transporting ATPase subunit b
LPFGVGTALTKEYAMGFSITLVIQGLVFFLVAWAVMRFVWPAFMGAMDARQKKIAEGLAAANRGEKELGEAEAKSKDIIREARDRAAQIVDEASKRSDEIIEQAKGTALSEAQQLVAQAHDEVARETTRAREGLRPEVGRVAVEVASHLLGREIDPKTHTELLDQLGARVANH